MPRKNPIPRERRIYIKPEDLSKLPKGIHVYRGVYGGLYVDKEELRRYKDQITDEKLREKLSFSEREEFAGETLENIISELRELNPEEVSEEIVAFVRDEIIPIVRYGMGSIIDLEKNLKILKGMLSYCDGEGINISDIRGLVDKAVSDAEELIDSDNFSVEEVGKMLTKEAMEKIKGLFSKNPPTAMEVLEDFVFDYGDVFSEIYDSILKYVKNKALAWRLSKMYYLMMIRTTDEGNYGVSRVIELALKDVYGGIVRPEGKVGCVIGRYNEADIEGKARYYVDEKSVLTWMEMMKAMEKEGVFDRPEKVYRGINEFERLMMLYKIFNSEKITGAVLVSNILTSFSRDFSVAKYFSPVVVEVDSEKCGLSFIANGWVSTSDFRHENEVTAVVTEKLPCKVYDMDGDLKRSIDYVNGKEIDVEDKKSMLFNIAILLSDVGINDLIGVLGENKGKEVIISLLRSMKRLLDEIRSEGEKADVVDCVSEIKALVWRDDRFKEYVDEVFGGDLNEW